MMVFVWFFFMYLRLLAVNSESKCFEMGDVRVYADVGDGGNDMATITNNTKAGVSVVVPSKHAAYP